MLYLVCKQLVFSITFTPPVTCLYIRVSRALTSALTCLYIRVSRALTSALTCLYIRVPRALTSALTCLYIRVPRKGTSAAVYRLAGGLDSFHRSFSRFSIRTSSSAFGFTKTFGLQVQRYDFFFHMTISYLSHF